MEENRLHRIIRRRKDRDPGDGFISKFKRYIADFDRDERKKLIVQLIISFFAAILIMGGLKQTWGLLQRTQDRVYIGMFFSKSLESIFPFLLLYAVINCLIIYLRVLLQKDTENDSRNFERSKKGTYGTAQKQSKKSYYETYDSMPVEEATKNIIGIDEYNHDNIITLKKLQGINDHKIVFGPSGSRKTRSRVIPDLFQYIKRGESYIVTDPKGEVYQKTSRIAKEHGYNVKVLNLKPTEISNSDGIDIFSIVGNNVMKAQTISDIIIRNTSGGQKEDSYFTPGAKSLLTACILYTTMSDLKPEEKTIGQMYQMLANNNAEKLSTIFSSLPVNHPARVAFQTFDGGTAAGKSSIWQGLLIRLQTLQDPILRKILSTPEISFTEPGNSPCAYYVIISDQESTLDFVTSLFFLLLFIQLVEYADKQPGLRLKVPVNFEMDEMPSIGPIPMLQRKIATVRSRGIIITMICQNQEQIEELYPNKVWKTIVSNCSTQILLAVNDDETAETFSKRSGEMTVNVKSIRYNERKIEPLKIHPSYQASDGLGKRYVYTADELYTMDPDYQLVVIQNRHVMMVPKFDYSMHPFAEYVIEEDNPEYINTLADKHIPQWRAALSEENMDTMMNQSAEIQNQIQNLPEDMRSHNTNRVCTPQPIDIEQLRRSASVQTPPQGSSNPKIAKAEAMLNKYKPL